MDSAGWRRVGQKLFQMCQHWAGGLQDELEQLLRLRPIVGCYRPHIDTSLWNPLKPAVVDFELERRWRAAQRECDALLARVMRRDPDDLIAAACR